MSSCSYTTQLLSCRWAHRLPARLLVLLAIQQARIVVVIVLKLCWAYIERPVSLLETQKNQFYRPHRTRVHLTRIHQHEEPFLFEYFFHVFLLYFVLFASLFVFSYIPQRSIMDFDLKERKLFDYKKKVLFEMLFKGRIIVEFENV